MDRIVKSWYHSTDELLDMLRNIIDYGHHRRQSIIEALQILTGDYFDEDEDWGIPPDEIVVTKGQQEERDG